MTSNSTPNVSSGISLPDPHNDSLSTGRSSGTGTLRSVSSSSSDQVVIPSVWRDDTQASIDAKFLDTDVRNISRTLTTLLTAKVRSHPRSQEIEQVARNLILKYPFMKDDLGSGYVSSFFCSFHMICLCVIYL